MSVKGGQSTGSTTTHPAVVIQNVVLVHRKRLRDNDTRVNRARHGFKQLYNRYNKVLLKEVDDAEKSGEMAIALKSICRQHDRLLHERSRMHEEHHNWLKRTFDMAVAQDSIDIARNVLREVEADQDLAVKYDSASLWSEFGPATDARSSQDSIAHTQTKGLSSARERLDDSPAGRHGLMLDPSCLSDMHPARAMLVLGCRHGNTPKSRVEGSD